MLERPHIRRIVPVLFLCFLSCGYPPPEIGGPRPTVSDPLYEDDHILELAWQIRDVCLRASGEATALVDRGGPDYGPLAFTTSRGLEVTYHVTPRNRLYHHEILLARSEGQLAVEVGLNLLHFVADLHGVSADEVTRDPDGRYRMLFDLDPTDERAVLENAVTDLEDDEILELWRQSVLAQVSGAPLRLREKPVP